MAATAAVGVGVALVAVRGEAVVAALEVATPVSMKKEILRADRMVRADGVDGMVEMGERVHHEPCHEVVR
jgi:hypothetical protein